MTDNLPRKLIVDPVSVDEVKELIKEALKDFSPSESGDVEVIEIDCGDNKTEFTLNEVVEIYKKLWLRKAIIHETSNGYYYDEINGDYLYLMFENPTQPTEIESAYLFYRSNPSISDETIVPNSWLLASYNSENDKYTFTWNEK